MSKDFTDTSQNDSSYNHLRLKRLDVTQTFAGLTGFDEAINGVLGRRRISKIDPVNSAPHPYQRLPIANLYHNEIDQASSISHEPVSNKTVDNIVLARSVEHTNNASKFRDELSKRIEIAQEKFNIVDVKYIEVQRNYMMLAEERKRLRKDLQDALSEEKSFEMEQIKNSREQIKQETKSKLVELQAAEEAIKRKYERRDSTLRDSEEVAEVDDEDSHSYVSLSEEEDEIASQKLDENEDEEDEEEIDVGDGWSEKEVITLVSLYDSNITLDKMIATLKRRFGTTRTMLECNEKYKEKAATIWRRKVILLNPLHRNKTISRTHANQ